MIALSVLQFILIETSNPFHLIFEFKKIFIASILVYSVLFGYGIATYMNSQYIITLKPISDDLNLGYIPSDLIEDSNLNMYFPFYHLF